MSLLPDLSQLSLKPTAADDGGGGGGDDQSDENPPNRGERKRKSPTMPAFHIWSDLEVQALKDAVANWFPDRAVTPWTELAEEWQRRYGLPGAQPGWVCFHRTRKALRGKWKKLTAVPKVVPPPVWQGTPDGRRQAQSPSPRSAPPRVDNPPMAPSAMPPPPPRSAMPPPPPPPRSAVPPTPTIQKKDDWTENDQRFLQKEMDDSWLISKLNNPKGERKIDWGVVHDAFLRERGQNRSKSMETIKQKGVPYEAVLRAAEAQRAKEQREEAETLGVLANLAAGSEVGGGN